MGREKLLQVLPTLSLAAAGRAHLIGVINRERAARTGQGRGVVTRERRAPAHLSERGLARARHVEAGFERGDDPVAPLAVPLHTLARELGRRRLDGRRERLDARLHGLDELGQLGQLEKGCGSGSWLVCLPGMGEHPQIWIF